jgi:hypothetical protein
MPCFLFDLTKPRHQRRCFHFSNMRPMWSSENVSRSNRDRQIGRTLTHPTFSTAQPSEMSMPAQ